jgi:diguanylate cyclase (GGDEF)-like protein
LNIRPTSIPLTGLANRRLLNDRLTQAILHTERTRDKVVAFVDLDQFKIINDTFGHELGDELLRTMAETHRVRAQADTVARQGGDEFVLLLTSYRDSEELLGVISASTRRYPSPGRPGGASFTYRSVGVAVYPVTAAPATCCCATPTWRCTRPSRRDAIISSSSPPKLNRMMVERVSASSTGCAMRWLCKQLLLHYQARVDVATGRVVGAEALLRWRMPRQGLISPARFISVAEETGLIVPIGKWVLQMACQQAMDWQVAGLPPLIVLDREHEATG